MTGGRRPGAAAAITREQIIDVAEAVAQAEGLEAITVRRVSAELGVTAAALYWHLADKQELVRALVDRASARTEFPPPEFGSWLDRLIRFYLSTREQFSAYPGLSSALVTAEPTEATLTSCMFVLGLLNEAGFDGATALEVFDALSMLSIGHLTMIDLARFNSRQARDDAISSYADRVRGVLETNKSYAVFVDALIDFDDGRSKNQLIRSIELVVRSAALEAGIDVPSAARFATTT